MKKSELKEIIKECMLEEATGISSIDREIADAIKAINKVISTLNKNKNAPGAKDYIAAFEKARKLVVTKG